MPSDPAWMGELVPEKPFTLADHIDVVALQMTQVSRQLKAAELSAEALRQFGDLLTSLADTVYLYAEKLKTPPRHALKEPPPPGGTPSPGR